MDESDDLADVMMEIVKWMEEEVPDRNDSADAAVLLGFARQIRSAVRASGKGKLANTNIMVKAV